MIKIIKKIFLYTFLLFIGMEILVRVFHLQNERPNRFLDENKVEKWVPNQNEYSITGNRKQNVGEYRINNFGFNSVHDDFVTTKDSLELAIVGDSFIEGFHEDYTNSLGQQVEKEITGSTILEFGYAGYDLADQLHLIYKYKELFKNIDHTFIYVKYTDDLDRDSYEVSSRLSLDSPVSRIIKKIKLLVYFKDIGMLDPVLKVPARVINFVKGGKTNVVKKSDKELEILKQEKDQKSLDNFIALYKLYGFNKDKFTLLLDKSLCSQKFLNYLNSNDFKTLDFGKVLMKSEKETTLVYDQHWSKHGRELMRNLLVDYIHKLN